MQPVCCPAGPAAWTSPAGGWRLFLQPATCSLPPAARGRLPTATPAHSPPCCLLPAACRLLWRSALPCPALPWASQELLTNLVSE